MALLPKSDNIDMPSVEQLSTEIKVLRYILNIIMIGVFICLCVHVISWIVVLWPQQGKQINPIELWLFIKPYHFTLNLEQRYLVMVTLGGVLGAFVHISTSFVDFLGSRKLSYTWIPWYLMRPFIGGALALIFYLLLRGGLISTSPPIDNGSENNEGNSTNKEITASTDVVKAGFVPIDSAKEDSTAGGKGTNQSKDPTKPKKEEKEKSVTQKEKKDSTIPKKEEKEQERENSVPVNPYGVMALACMAGMFSKQATDKLREVFDSLFRMKAGNETGRADPLHEKETGNPSETSTSNGPVPRNDDAAAG